MFLQEKILDINQRLEILENVKNIVIWGAGIHTVKMYEMTNLISYSIKNIVDMDEKKQGKKYFGFIVQNPKKGIDWQNVNAVVISVHGKEKTITEMLVNELGFSGQIIILYGPDEQKAFYCLFDKEDSLFCHVGDYENWVRTIRNRLNVKQWISKEFNYIPTKDEVKKERGEVSKIVVGILHCQETSYNMIRSLYDAFESDSSCMPTVILQGKGYTNHYQALETQMKENEMRYEFDYNCADRKFDVLIVHHVQLQPTDDVKTIISNSVLKVAVPIGVISYNVQGLNADNIRSYQATDICCEKSIYEKTPQDIRKEFHCYVTRNPKFDCIYDAYRHNVKIPTKFEKLISPEIKKIILWTTDHKTNNQLCTSDVAFDLYASAAFNYINKHQDVGLIFRPYSTYIRELIRDGLMSEEQVDYFKNYCQESSNIVWDDEPDYSASYSMADAIIADAGCGIICSALPMMKPMGITLRWDMDVSNILGRNREILENHYLIRTEAEMLSFFGMVMEGKDPNFDKRKIICEKYVTHFDGKNGERIKNIIKEELHKRECHKDGCGK